MVSATKLFVLGFLVASTIVLGTTVLTLSFFVEKKRRAVRNRRRASSNASAGSSDRTAALASETSMTTTRTRTSTRPKFKTVRPVSPPDGSDLSLHRTGPAPYPTEARTAADAHYAKAMRLMPFENTGGEAGNAIPFPILYGSEGRQGRRGADFVKWEKDGLWGRRSMVYGRRRGGSMGTSPIEVGERKGVGGIGAWGWGDGVLVLPRSAALFLRLVGLDPHGEAFRSVRRWISDRLGAELMPPGEAAEDSSTSSSSSAGDGGAAAARRGEGEDARTRSHRDAREALFHLERAADLGHPDAQYTLANALASGVLPVDNSIRRSLNQTLTVSSDFSEGGPQLARAIVLWHAAAVGGHAEAAMALGYRHRYSAMGGRHDTNHIISDEDLALDGGGGAVSGGGGGLVTSARITAGGITIVGSAVTGGKNAGAGGAGRATHPAAPSAHYGVLGTCESAAAYYEAAANAVMDEIDASPLRGKVNPMLDKHRLAEIHMHGGASSALQTHNKPDELEEALQYYRLRASPDRNAKPDVSAAYTLANFYHYGMRGVKQDMKLALKYYEIAAAGGSWEAAGQAGKFYLWGMGVDEEGRDLLKAYDYFRKGTPGGVEGCSRRLRAKRDSKKAGSSKKAVPEDDEYDEDEYDEDDGNLCDHPCVNGMGLLHLMGVPNLLNPNPGMAKKYFSLARDMGNMDASYNLAMMSLGWMDGTSDLHGDQASRHAESAEKVTSNASQAQGSLAESTQMKSTLISATEDIDINNGEVIITVTSVKSSSKIVEGVQNPDTESGRGDRGTPPEASDGGAEPKTGTLKEDGGVKDAFSTADEGRVGPETTSSRASARTGPTKVDYSFAFREFVKAAQKGHIQAKHKLGQMLINGVRIPDPMQPGKNVEAVAKNCPLALTYYRDVVDNGLLMSKRTRVAYKQYVAGEYESSLRNYLAAAESGSAVGQINAAFLLERGYCLGMSRVECMRASVRLWRAAARQGNEEACLRVGDFYYYGRLQEDADDGSAPLRDGAEVGMKEMERRRNAVGYAMGPFPWVRYLIYPEDAIPLLRKKMIRVARWLLSKLSRDSLPASDRTGAHSQAKDRHAKECPADEASADGTCTALDAPSPSPVHVKEEVNDRPSKGGRSRDDHLAIAAQYYRRAAEEHDSPRANFNLGFMHEWGLGLKQDFPLAKRHYDLAVSTIRSGEAELAVSMALMVMNVHEKVMRVKIAWDEWQEVRSKRKLMHSAERILAEEFSPSPAGNGVGHPVQPIAPTIHGSFFSTGNARLDIILKHLLSWEIAVVLFLLVVLTLLVQGRVLGPNNLRR